MGISINQMVTAVTKVDILAIGVHPDDVELSCSGTILKHIQLGYTVGLLDLTLGELGTRGTKEIRTAEAKLAAEKMGVQFRYQLDLGDAFMQWNEDTLRQIIPIIRAARPRIVLLNAIHDRHPDHGKSSKIAADACFFSGLRMIKTTFQNEDQEAHRPEVVYHYIQDQYIKPDVIVDISEFIDKKMEVIKCFKSQFYNPESTEPESAISGVDFLEVVLSKARLEGRAIGVSFGEGFTVDRPIGAEHLFLVK